MHFEPATEKSAASRGRRRKRGGDEPAEGPVFVDNSGRRSKLLRRIGVLLGVLCLGYAVVLGLAFLGIGVSSSSLLPFAGGGPGAGAGSGSGPGGLQPQGGIGSPPALPTGTPQTAAPTASATASD
ncbi:MULTISPECIES: hypothetical protein [Streptomyces]|uniref:hypothetical protein n=1 Tax=Streptomyces TaxID=1883 RepID=UPI0033222B37